MSNLSRSRLCKFLATIAVLSSVSAILTTANKAEAVPMYPNDLVNNQVVRLQMEKSAPNGAPVTINITPNYGFKNDGIVNTWVGAVDDDSLFKYLTNGFGINFQRVNSSYSISSKDLNVVQGNAIVSYGSGFGRYQDWNLEKIGGQYGDTYLFHWRTDINTNLCLDVRGFTQGQQLNNRTPVLWNCDRNNVNQRIRVIKQGQVLPPPPQVVPPIIQSQRKVNDFVNQWNGKTGITRYDLGGSDYNGQCVTLIARYLQDHYGAPKTGLSIGNGGQTAYTVGNNFPSFIWNTNADPKPGSIISFPSLGLIGGIRYGHVALVVSAQRSATNSNLLNIKILDSNGEGAGPNSVVRQRDITVDTRYWTAPGYGSILYSNPRD
jgi:hypothetical protein